MRYVVLGLTLGLMVGSIPQASAQIRPRAATPSDKTGILDRAVIVTTPTAEKGYFIDLVRVYVKRIWYHGIGQRDAVLLRLMVYDTGAEDKAQALTFAFKSRSGQDYFLELERLFGPRPIQGEVRVIGNLMLTHPQKFGNIRDAMKKLAETEGVALETIGEATDKEVLVVAGKVLSKPQVQEATANFWTETLKVVGTIACAGNNPLTFTDRNENALDPKELGANTGAAEFRLFSFIHGAKLQTCWREIWYRVFVRTLHKT
jgi:hypothetical protein